MGENFEAFKEKIWFDFEGAEKEEAINLNTFAEKYYNGIKKSREVKELSKFDLNRMNLEKVKSIILVYYLIDSLYLTFLP